MRMLLATSTVAVCLFGTFSPLAAEPPPLPADTPIEQVIDQFVTQRLQSEKVAPSAQVDDLNLLRRLTLDLAGRIPTTPEAHSYAVSTSTVKRAELVERLLASPDYAFHHRNELERLLLPKKTNNGDFRKYLLWAVQQNRAWDVMFRDMLVGDENDEQRRAALTFVKARATSVDDLTNDTASLFLGVNVSCAKCHDHPLAPDWQQDHFYGLSAFFSRTYLTKKNLLAEKSVGEVKFSTTKGVEKQAKFLFLTGVVIDEPTVERSKDDLKTLDEEVKLLMKEDNAPPPTKPDFSPRNKLVEVALRSEENRFFARNIVNRIWARMLGRGLVDPLDQMHSANVPSHPELLDWLTRDLVAHGYDLKRLLRGIALSQTYSRSSEWASPGEPPAPALFAVAKIKPLSPRQYGLSLSVASHNPTQWPTSDQAEQWATRREQLEGATDSWVGQIEAPGDSHFQIAVDEALLFSNSNRIDNELIRDSGDKLVGHLKSLESTPAVIDAAYWAICSRPPHNDERQAVTAYLEKHSSDRLAALRQVVWALLTNPELRFNY